MSLVRVAEVGTLAVVVPDRVTGSRLNGRNLVAFFARDKSHTPQWHPQKMQKRQILIHQYPIHLQEYQNHPVAPLKTMHQEKVKELVFPGDEMDRV